MNRLKKVICGILVACMMCGLLAGCGSDGVPETGYVHFNTSGGGVWNMYGWITQDELDWYKENAIDNYQQYYADRVTDIKVVGNDGKTRVALDNEANFSNVQSILYAFEHDYLLENISAGMTTENGQNYMNISFTVKSQPEFDARIEKEIAEQYPHIEPVESAEQQAADARANKLVTSFAEFDFTFPGEVVVSGNSNIVKKTGTNTAHITLDLQDKKETITIKGSLTDNGNGTVTPPAQGSLDNFKKVNTYNGQFTDVPANAWYKKDMATAYELGLVSGTSANSFNPNGQLSITEAMVLAARVRSIYNGDNHDFTAKPGEYWFDPYFDYVFEQGIINESTFHLLNGGFTNMASGTPDYGSITRSSMAYLFASALPDTCYPAIKNVTNIPYDKTDGKPGYATWCLPIEECESAIYKLYNAGILSGEDSKGTMSIYKYITRAEVVTILSRVVDIDSRK
ncbi:S-layer homology domain-containing protein [uncultured Flavonifractor sp.]|uniref:S-layer homology domain-containing protein n=1 Tax=Candidatus Flavonifractor intestinigallinarum TaxID=2838586 RepID=A0A9D2MNZ3_9FIRM|nr:S-layer homology domain-containing protein [uncultured Flavonifractor sp.]HJB80633.1 S-layer homology domain-containing protein [Candidatus Flavonifractor intestinigallinarum]